MEAVYMGTGYGGKGKPWIGVDMENGTGSHPRVFPSAGLFFFFFWDQRCSGAVST